MTPNEFYDHYGRYIFEAQRTANGYNKWPYLILSQDPYNSEGDSFRKLTHPLITIPEKFTKCGFDYKCTIPFSAVKWRGGYITYYPIINGSSKVISYEFDGCYMVKFQFQNCWFAGHIHSKRIKDWVTFQEESGIKTVALFRPVESANDRIQRIASTIRNNYKLNNNSLSENDIKNTIQICGLITPDNKCFSAVMDVNICFPYHIERKHIMYPNLQPLI